MSSRDLYARLLKYVKPYTAALLGGVAAMIIGGLADASIVKLSGPLIDELFVRRNESLAILLPLAVVAVFFVSGSRASLRLRDAVGRQQVILDLRREMFAKVLRPAPGVLRRDRHAQLVTKFTNDVNNLAPPGDERARRARARHRDRSPPSWGSCSRRTGSSRSSPSS
jgi:subfamily B ATP-binding cassette protein MsbA